MWDAFNRLCAIRDQGGDPRIFYIYDATNRRVRKEGEVEGVDFYYSGWRVLEERDSGDDPTRQYIWGNYLDEALVMDVNGNEDGYCTSFTLQQNPDARYYYLQNTLYSVYALTDQSAAVIEAYEYDPYGRHTLLTDGDYDGAVNFDETDDRALLGDGNGESNLGNPLTFTGQRYDGTYGATGTGLHYFKERPFDCVRGRFPSRDPETTAFLRNRYAYVDNKAPHATDPKGLAPVSAMGYHHKTHSPYPVLNENTIHRATGGATKRLGEKDGGTTTHQVTVSCECWCDTSGRLFTPWYPWSCTVTHIIDSTVRPYMDEQETWYESKEHYEWGKRCENDHVDDFKMWWTVKGQKLGLFKWQQLINKGTRSIWSRAGCEEKLEDAIRRAYKDGEFGFDSVGAATRKTIEKHDKTGKHTWSNTAHRRP